jgi:phytoene dehydrogenase-like protein
VAFHNIAASIREPSAQRLILCGSRWGAYFTLRARSAQGALILDQLFSARPMLGYGDYRGPLKGLYMCGSGTHPGGGVTGAPGHKPAREIIADFRRGRLRQP